MELSTNLFKAAFSGRSSFVFVKVLRMFFLINEHICYNIYTGVINAYNFQMSEFANNYESQRK